MKSTIALILAAATVCGVTQAQEQASPTDEQIAEGVERYFEKEGTLRTSYGPKGIRLESRDGKFQTNLQWRAQLRVTSPYRTDPRQIEDLPTDELTAEARRLRMKIGGHGYQPWLKYYFEVDLQPTRSLDDDSVTASARVIDWRIDIDKNKAFGIRAGQWKIDFNRERVDSSGRQQFVERSIVNRVFTIDRQVGLGFRGRLFEGTGADFRYYAGAFTGEGRGASNNDDNLMYAGRLQWNFLGRDLGLRQTDVERTEKPTGSLALGGATHTGKATRWSSGGGGNLDGFSNVLLAEEGQYRVQQAVAEFAFKYQGFSTQNEYHWKNIQDTTLSDGQTGNDSDLRGLYSQFGYFFNEVWSSFPEELELAARYGWLKEPNETNLDLENERQEFTIGANWFFNGHNNKLTLDYSYLTIDDAALGEDGNGNRIRLQWDISF
ncbi:MAG: phosphate-selective porin OprO/OprP [Kiritimatiellia bacterium]|jgi:phosphate-selective porin OprO/OprP